MSDRKLSIPARAFVDQLAALNRRVNDLYARSWSGALRSAHTDVGSGTFTSPTTLLSLDVTSGRWSVMASAEIVDSAPVGVEIWHLGVAAYERSTTTLIPSASMHMPHARAAAGAEPFVTADGIAPRITTLIAFGDIALDEDATISAYGYGENAGHPVEWLDVRLLLTPA